METGTIAKNSLRVGTVRTSSEKVLFVLNNLISPLTFKSKTSQK